MTKTKKDQKTINCCQINPAIQKSIAGVDEVVEFLKIISEKSRLQILCLLKEGEKCVCEIYKPLSIPQNLASHHLKILRDFNLIDYRREGRKIIYFSNKKTIKQYNKKLAKFLSNK